MKLGSYRLLASFFVASLLVSCSSGDQQNIINSGLETDFVAGAETGFVADTEADFVADAETDFVAGAETDIAVQQPETLPIDPTVLDTAPLATNPDQTLSGDDQSSSFALSTVEPRANPQWRVSRILDSPVTSSSAIHTQQTPIDAKDGFVYVVGIESGANGDGRGIRQNTTIKQGQINEDGVWIWKKRTITDNTLFNPWHTPPSVGVDRMGYIHVTYNMHNSPWQYVVSANPHDIDSFEFKGQEVSDEQFSELEFQNLTNFESLGTAGLPGSQITYPAFYKNNEGVLFLSYRAAAKPARRFMDRTMSGMIAEYDEQTRQWIVIGSPVPLGPDDVKHVPGSHTSISAFAAQPGWTVYHPKLAFTDGNEMHVMWFWRPGIAGSQLNRPCHAVSEDKQNFYALSGEYLPLPVQSSHCGNLGLDGESSFYTIADLKMDIEGKPHVLLSPVGKSREILHYNKNEQRWVSERSPSNASHLFFDKNGRQWAVAEGLTLLYRDATDSPWTLFYQEDHNDCFAKTVWNEEKTKAYIHTQDCDSKSMSVYELELL